MAALGKIKFLTVHCTATPEGDARFTAQRISEIDIQRFAQVSYHWVIELDGKAVRTLPDTVRGAHVGKANTGNIGIAYVGGVAKDGKTPKDTRTPAQKATLRRLIQEYQAANPGIKVLGHRNWPNVAKACPSFDLPTWLKAGMPV